MVLKEIVMGAGLLVLSGCYNEQSNESEKINSAIVNKISNSYPDDFYIDTKNHGYVKVRDENGQIRDFGSELKKLENKLTILKEDGARSEEILNIKRLIAQGYYLWGYFGEGSVDEGKIYKAKDIAIEIWNEDSDFLKGKNDGQMLILSGHESEYKGRLKRQTNKSYDLNSIKEDIYGEYWVNSKPLKLNDLKGKVVLLDFWAINCPPCIAELPKIEKMWQKYKDKDFMVIGIHSATGSTVIFENWLRGRDITFPIVIDDDRTFDKYNVDTIPRKVLYDKTGNIRKISSKPLEGLIEDLLKE